MFLFTIVYNKLRKAKSGLKLLLLSLAGWATFGLLYSFNYLSFSETLKSPTMTRFLYEYDVNGSMKGVENKQYYASEFKLDIKSRFQLVMSMLKPHLEDLDRIRLIFRKDYAKLKPWKNGKNITVSQMVGLDSNFFTSLASVSNVKISFLKTSWTLLQDVYPIHSFNNVFSNCDVLLEHFGDHFEKMGFGKFPSRHPCTSNMSELTKDYPMAETQVRDYLLFSGGAEGMVVNDYQKLYPKDKHIPVSYVTVVANGFVNREGDIYDGEHKVVNTRCRNDLTPESPKREEIAAAPFHKEVFTIATKWDAYFHILIESMPKLMPYVPFLLRHPEIKIHIFPTEAYIVKYMFRYLGLNKNRIVKGHVKALIIYQPGGTRCGGVNSFNARLYNLWFQYKPPNVHDLYTNKYGNRYSKQLYNRPTQSKAQTNDETKGKPIVLIVKRHEKRWFEYHKSIENMVRQYSKPYNIEVVVFDDIKLPPFKNTIRLFQNAVAVVAPHGAGLANLIFSRPGTTVIEGLCAKTGPEDIPNICYVRLSKALGMQYYGHFDQKNCFKTTAEDLKKPFLKFLEKLKDPL